MDVVQFVGCKNIANTRTTKSDLNCIQDKIHEIFKIYKYLSIFI